DIARRPEHDAEVVEPAVQSVKTAAPAKGSHQDVVAQNGEAARDSRDPDERAAPLEGIHRSGRKKSDAHDDPTDDASLQPMSTRSGIQGPNDRGLYWRLTFVPDRRAVGGRFTRGKVDEASPNALSPLESWGSLLEKGARPFLVVLAAEGLDAHGPELLAVRVADTLEDGLDLRLRAAHRQRRVRSHG